MSPEKRPNPANPGVVIDYSDAELEFLKAMEAYQSANKRRFPTFCEVLAVAHALGYRRVADPAPLPTFGWYSK